MGPVESAGVHMSQDRGRRQARGAGEDRRRSGRASDPSAAARGWDAARSVLGKVGSGARRAGSAVTPHFRRASKESVRAQAEQDRAAGRGHGVSERDTSRAAARRGDAAAGRSGHGAPQRRNAGARGRSEAPGVPSPRRAGAGCNVALAGRGQGRAEAPYAPDERAPYGDYDQSISYGRADDGRTVPQDRGGRPGRAGTRRSGYAGRDGAYRSDFAEGGANGYGDAYGSDAPSGYAEGYDRGRGYASDRSSGYAGPDGAPYGAEAAGYADAPRPHGRTDRIVPDTPRKPHRYVQPDLGPAPGASSRRGGVTTSRHHGRRLFLAHPARRHSVLPLVIIGVVALVLVGAGAAMINGYISAQRAAEEAAAAAEEQAEREREQAELISSFSIANADLDDIPSASDAPALFSLSGAGAPKLTSSEQKALATAIAPVEELGDVGFTLIDLQTGFGLAYNTDERVYGASSFKLPYAVYLCQDLVEGGELALDDVCPESANGWSVSDLIRASVVESDNDSFVSLREAYDDADFDAWIEDLGVTDARYDQLSFPTLSTRSLTKLWANAYRYFQSGTQTATWLEGLCGQTTTSFIRDGITQPGITVYDKAGWYPSEEVSYRSVTDAGIVEDADGDAYLMVIMTSMSYSDEAASAFGNLANIIFETRGALAADTDA